MLKLPCLHHFWLAAGASNLGDTCFPGVITAD